jgi:hypothetical protein
MKKKVLIFMNCHGVFINYWLVKNGIFEQDEILKVALHRLLDQETLPENVKEYAGECDVMILQYIKTNRGELNHDFVTQLKKPSCNVILIPHYTCEIYRYNDIPFRYYEEIHDDNVTDYLCDSNIIADFFKSIQEKDGTGNVKMESFVRSNFDKKILFNDRNHPNALFFHEMVQQISKILKRTSLSHQKHNKVFPYADKQEIEIYLEH